MATSVSKYINVKEHAEKLGLSNPDGIALLPRNFPVAKRKEDLVYADEAATVRALWRKAGVPLVKVEKDGDKFPSSAQDSIEWVGPTIFISLSVLSQNPAAVSLAFNVLGNYLTDFFKGFPKGSKVKLNVIIEKSKNADYREISFVGSSEDFKNLPKVIQQLRDNE